MRKETMNPQMSNWTLERIPVTPATVRAASSGYGVTLTEIEFGKNNSVSTGSWTGYPYVSLKK
ncbi:MAG: hypothetical protein ABR986_07195 [Methanomassiliicoccales archaeon]